MSREQRAFLWRDTNFLNIWRILLRTFPIVNQSESDKWPHKYVNEGRWVLGHHSWITDYVRLLSVMSRVILNGWWDLEISLLQASISFPKQLKSHLPIYLLHIAGGASGPQCRRTEQQWMAVAGVDCYVADPDYGNPVDVVLGLLPKTPVALHYRTHWGLQGTTPLPFYQFTSTVQVLEKNAASYRCNFSKFL